MAGETYPRFEREAMLGDQAARRGERELPRRPVTLAPMEPGDIVEAPVTRHADHDPELPCRPALGNGLCYPAPADARLVPWREALSSDGGDR